MKRQFRLDRIRYTHEFQAASYMTFTRILLDREQQQLQFEDNGLVSETILP